MYYLVRKVAAVTGSDLRSASVGLDENNRPAVMFSLKPDGARKFGQVTGANIGRSLAIVLDDRVQSVPAHRRADHERGPHLRQLHAAGGGGPRAQAALRRAAGVADLPRGARHRPDASAPTRSARASPRRSPASLLVVLFMLVYYKLSGINAVVAMVVNLIILLGMMAYVGRDDDAARHRRLHPDDGHGRRLERADLRAHQGGAGGATRARARRSTRGFDRVFWTLLDTHVASLIAAAFLFQFGTGPIRGFATTLFVGLISNLFTSIFVSRTLFEFVLSRRPANAQTVSI